MDTRRHQERHREMFPFAALPLSGAPHSRVDHAPRDAVEHCGRGTRMTEPEAEENKCRICWETDGQLCKPCVCSGSIAFVHEACLSDWQRRQYPHESAFICSVCRSNYTICPFPRPVEICGFAAQHHAYLYLKAAAVLVLLLAGKTLLKLVLALAFPLQFFSLFMFLGFFISTLPFSTQLTCLSLLLKGMLRLHRLTLDAVVFVNRRARQMTALLPLELRPPLTYLLDCSDKVNEFSRAFIFEVEQHVGLLIDMLVR